jgi:hypothetical protein
MLLDLVYAYDCFFANIPENGITIFSTANPPDNRIPFSPVVVSVDPALPT